MLEELVVFRSKSDIVEDDGVLRVYTGKHI